MPGHPPNKHPPLTSVHMTESGNAPTVQQGGIIPVPEDAFDQQERVTENPYELAEAIPAGPFSLIIWMKRKHLAG